MKRLGLTAILAATLATGCGIGNERPDGSGTIECTQVRVAAEVGGRIADIAVREGDFVRKGDPVVKIEDTSIGLKLDEASAALAQAQAQLDMLKAGAREEDIARAKEQVREATAAGDAAQQDLKRVREVFEKQSATQKQLDDATAAAERTAAAVAGAEQMLARLTNGSRPEEIRMAEAQADMAKARVAQAKKAMTDSRVMAPISGTVTTRSAEPGEVVGAGTSLVTLSKLDEVWLSIYVPETRLASVKTGGKARVRIDGSKTVYEGTVSFISPEAEFTPKNVQTPDERAKLVYRVKIALENPDGVFKPGMPADAYLKP